MSRLLGWIVSGACCVSLVGCGQSSAPQGTTTSTAQVAAPAEVPAAELVEANKLQGSPQQCVTDFLNAFTCGDEKGARQMLTPVARERTANMDLARDLKVSGGAKFSVGEVEFVTEGAHVACTWTDVDDEGKAYSTPMVWFVAAVEEEGWRIAGMGVKVFPNQPPLILNYEDPESMQQKLLALEEEVMRRQNAVTGEAETSHPVRGEVRTADRGPQLRGAQRATEGQEDSKRAE